MAQAGSSTQRDQRGLTSKLGNVEIDWPRSLGFFGALGAAVALDLVPVPIAFFVGSVPFFKLLNQPDAPTPQRFFSHVMDGAAKPVGGDSEGTIRWARSRTSAGAKSGTSDAEFGANRGRPSAGRRSSSRRGTRSSRVRRAAS